MDDNKRYVRLGIFVTTSLCALVGALFALSSPAWFQSTFVFETYFDKSIAGLELGAPATFRGVPLGHVSEILTSVGTYERSVPVDRRRDYIVVRVRATMPAAEAAQMKADMAAFIRRGLRAQTQLAGVTGQQYLELDFLEPGRYPPLPFNWTPESIYLPSAPSVAGQIIEKAQEFLASLDGADIAQLGRNLNTLVRDLDATLHQVPVADLSARARGVLQTAEKALGHIDAALGDPALRATLDNAAAISARLRKISDNGDLDRLVTRLDDAAARLDVLVGDNQYDVRAIVQDLRLTSDNLRTLSETLKVDPGSVLFGRPPGRIRLPESAP